jgi:quercetin dioxygenase-like cupin family protein
VAEVTVKRVEEFEGIYAGGLKRVRSGLGVESFGIAVLDFPPRFDAYPEHDHSGDGQEEVYTALSGRATLTAGGAEYTLEPGVFARVPSGVPRTLSTGEEPARLLALGGTPGAVYEPPSESEEGNPDPLTGGEPISA